MTAVPPDFTAFLAGLKATPPPAAPERVPVRRRPPAPEVDRFEEANTKLKEERATRRQGQGRPGWRERRGHSLNAKRSKLTGPPAHPNDAANRRVRRARESKARADKHCTELLDKWFPDGVPDGQPVPPYLPRAVFARGLSIASDSTGKQALRALNGVLPHEQEVALLYCLTAVAQLRRIGRAHLITREDVRGALDTLDHENPADRRAMMRESRYALRGVIGRRFVQAAVGMWGLSRKVPHTELGAWRGRVRKVEGFCRTALAWTCPTWEGEQLSVSTLFGVHGPFAILAEASSKLGRAEPGESGLGLYKRWQPKADAPGVRHVGPPKRREDGTLIINPKTGEPVAFAVGMTAYAREMCGRTTVERARLGDASARALLEGLDAAASDDVEDLEVELVDDLPVVSEDLAADLAAAFAEPPPAAEPRPPPE